MRTKQSLHNLLALQSVQEGVLPEMPADADLADLHTQIVRAYQLSGQTDKALVMAAERDRLS